MASWIFPSSSRTTGIYSSKMMTYFQLAISPLALGSENCVPRATRTATPTKAFHLFLVPVCVVCKSVTQLPPHQPWLESGLCLWWGVTCLCWLLLGRAAWGAEGLLSLPRSIPGHPWHWHHWSSALWNEVGHLLDTLQSCNTSLGFQSSHHGDFRGDPSRWSLVHLEKWKNGCNFLE